MKQFYETYSAPELVSTLLTLIENPNENKIVSPVVAQTQLPKNEYNIIVLALPTLLKILSTVTWTNHLEIISQTKSPEEKLFYLVHCINEKWSMWELRRQLNTGFYEKCIG